MNRIRQHRHVEPLAPTLELLPPRIVELLRCEVLAGADPVAAGLHRYVDASFGRSYRSTCHVAYEMHQEHLPRARRAVTLVLPEVPTIATVMHELGHVLHAALDLEPQPLPVTDYALLSGGMEAFAEAFAAWALPFGHGYGSAKDRLYERDRATVALLDGLAAA
ncbi:hypothetical protein [Micromonospora sp. 4G55]|uniref:hypothetical protein n=1 Tax=Micromonospora sp. 4G55 TaxID=2806102 RepID=UPI001A5E8D7A|nr:hypothetical protein [Micromonospora sp. 4G55]MBM0257371.1 hypothetical protein [Micromonospora sp. 4G55]